jgi:hypothetical protein
VNWFGIEIKKIGLLRVLDIQIPLTETVLIPKEVYHRVIKGTGDLTVKIKKLND